MVQLTLSGNFTKPQYLLTSYKQKGFTYIGLLVIMAVMLMVMGAASGVWHTVMQQEKEQELLFIGHEFRVAIRQYYIKSGSKFPPSLDALVEIDDASGKKAHFLRKIYLDPMTNNTQWGIVAGQGGGLAGVYSLSEEKPLKVNGFADIDATFSNAEKYSDWKFVYKPAVVRGQGGVGTIVNGYVRPIPRVK
jgi:type II secretory pathway pseudopilin PulG